MGRGFFNSLLFLGLKWVGVDWDNKLKRYVPHITNRKEFIIMKKKISNTNIDNLLNIVNRQQETIELLLPNHESVEINAIESKNVTPTFKNTSEELEYQKEQAKTQKDQMALEMIVLKQKFLTLEQLLQECMKEEKEKRKQYEQNCKQKIAHMESKVKKQSQKQKKLKVQQEKLEKVILKLARFVLASAEIDSLKDVEREIKITQKYNKIEGNSLFDKERRRLP